MLVEILGSAGSGKSVINELLCERLGTQHEMHVISLREIPRNVIVRETSLGDKIAAATGALRVSRKATRRRALRGAYSTILRSRYANRLQASTCGGSTRSIVITDQEVAFYLKKYRVPKQFWSAFVLPNVIVEILTPSNLTVKRQIVRDKEVVQDKIRYGNARIAKLRHKTKRLIEGGESDVLELMQAWNQKFNKPPLNDSQLREAGHCLAGVREHRNDQSANPGR